MVGITEISGVLASLQAAKEIAESLINLRGAEASQSKILELQARFLEAQQAAFSAQQHLSALVDRVAELEKEIAQLKAWNCEKERYALKAIGNGAFAYLVKPEAALAEPVHALCANCYGNHKKSILQSNGEVQWTSHAWVCPSCKAAVKANKSAVSQAFDAEKENA